MIIGLLFIVTAISLYSYLINKDIRIFKIYKGQHYSIHEIAFLKDDRLNFSVYFDDSCKYLTKNPNNQQDINKLYGFTDCNSLVHTNSARFGWVWNPNTELIDIYSYCYINKQRKFKYLDSVKLNTWNDLSIILYRGYYCFLIKKNYYFEDREQQHERGLYVMLYPHFGGDETAPHDIKIRIKNL